MGGLRAAIANALDAAQWPYRDGGPPLAIGTSLFLDAMIIGGSIQIFEDVQVVRLIAFGGVAKPNENRSQLDEVIDLINPSLLDVAFEIDAVLGMPVCRLAVRLQSEDSDEISAQAVISGLGTVTANFAAVAPVFIGISESGLTAQEALLLMRPTAPPLFQPTNSDR